MLRRFKAALKAFRKPFLVDEPSPIPYTVTGAFVGDGWRISETGTTTRIIDNTLT